MPIYPKEYLDYARLDKLQSNCFVLMPFARQFDEVHHAIWAACRSPRLLLNCVRADDFFGGGHIMEDIMKGIVHSEYIVADLTGKNPNVFYELGIAHCCKPASKVVIISQTMNDVPFDLRHMRCIIYEHSPMGLKQLSRDVEESIASDLAGAYCFEVADGDDYVCPERLTGRGRNFYTFSLPKVMLGRTALKLDITVQRHSLDEGPAQFGPDHHYLEIGESITIPQTSSKLRLDRIENNRARFSVVPREE